MTYLDLTDSEKSNSLIWEDVYNKLPNNLKDKYVNLMSSRHDIKYALRTINILVDKDTLEETIEYYKNDLDDGSWTIGVVDYSNQVDKYFSENTIEEFYEDIIIFCEDWE